MSTETFSLQAITGTPKQIAWAEDIRRALIASFEEGCEEFREDHCESKDEAKNAENLAKLELARSQFQAFLNREKMTGNSEYWIRRRGLFVPGWRLVHLFAKPLAEGSKEMLDAYHWF